MQVKVKSKQSSQERSYGKNCSTLQLEDTFAAFCVNQVSASDPTYTLLSLSFWWLHAVGSRVEQVLVPSHHKVDVVRVCANVVRQCGICPVAQ